MVKIHIAIYVLYSCMHMNDIIFNALYTKFKEKTLSMQIQLVNQIILGATLIRSYIVNYFIIYYIAMYVASYIQDQVLSRAVKLASMYTKTSYCF